jgi:hypothetical protein
MAKLPVLGLPPSSAEIEECRIKAIPLYTFMCHQKNAGQNQNIRPANEPFANLLNIKCLGHN